MPLLPNEPQATSLAELSGIVLESRYELGRVLGTGGMGALFEAKHPRLDRAVAIKVLRPLYAGHDEYIRRFLSEAKSISKIRHRNVAEILDCGDAEGGLVYLVYSVMEDWVCGLLIQTASDLEAAHGREVIHRDISRPIASSPTKMAISCHQTDARHEVPAKKARKQC